MLHTTPTVVVIKRYIKKTEWIRHLSGASDRRRGPGHSGERTQWPPGGRARKRSGLGGGVAGRMGGVMAGQIRGGSGLGESLEEWVL